MIVAGFLSYRASEAILQRKSVAFPEWEFKWMMGSMIAFLVWGLLKVGYTYFFEREKWLQRWRERQQLPRRYWITAAVVCLALLTVQYFSSLSSPKTFLTAVLWLFIAVSQVWYWRNRNWTRWKWYLAVVFWVGLAGWEFQMAFGEINEDLRTCVGRTYFQRTEVKSFECDVLRKIRPRFTYVTSNPVPNTRVTCMGTQCWKRENGVVVDCGPNWNCMDDPNYNLFTRPNRLPILHSNAVINCSTTTDPTTGVVTRSCVTDTITGDKEKRN